MTNDEILQERISAVKSLSAASGGGDFYDDWIADLESTPADAEFAVGDKVRVDNGLIVDRFGTVTQVGKTFSEVIVDGIAFSFLNDAITPATEFAVGDTVRIDYPAYPKIHGRVGVVTGVYEDGGLNVSIEPDVFGLHVRPADVRRVDAETLGDTAIGMVNEAYLLDTASDWMSASNSLIKALADAGLYNLVRDLSALIVKMEIGLDD